MGIMEEATVDIFANEEPEGVMNIRIKDQNSKPGDPNFNTLDEPIEETIKRDLKAVGVKFSHVLFPTEKKSLLKEWDLWGPLFLCTFIAILLHGSSGNSDKEHDGGPEFAEVFLIVWIGSAIVTLNSQLLGGNISFFQSVCVLGYCLLPTLIALVLCKTILMTEQTKLLFFLRFFITTTGFLWATYASTKFLGNSQPPKKKTLAVYPICLFYFIISWLIISHTN